MSPLFGNREQKAADEAAAAAEAARLTGLSPSELAVELMPVFGPGGPKASAGTGGLNLLQIGIALMEKFPRGVSQLRQLEQPMREALQVLEHSELISRTTIRTGTWFSVTRLGESALADGSVASHVDGRS